MKTRSLRSSSTSISFWVPLAGNEMFNFIFARVSLVEKVELAMRRRPNCGSWMGDAASNRSRAVDVSW
jgi:hypothetical protein